MSKRAVIHIRRFRCKVCGAEISAPKRKNTGIGHIKTMMCPVCREIRDFVQYDTDRTR